jgi:hypothetical protein
VSTWFARIIWPSGSLDRYEDDFVEDPGDVVFPALVWDLSGAPSSLVAAIAAGTASVEIHMIGPRPSPLTSGLIIREVYLSDVDAPAPPPPPPPPAVVREQVTRQYPRDDALGLGSAERVYPPPRRGRAVGGYL